MVQIGHKLKKWQWNHNFRHCVIVRFFWGAMFLLSSLVNGLSLMSIYNNVNTGSGVTTIFVYEGFTRNPEMGNILVWVLPNIWRLGRVRDTKFDTNDSNEKLLEAVKVTAFTVSELLSTSPPPSSAQIMVKKYSTFYRGLCFKSQTYQFFVIYKLDFFKSLLSLSVLFIFFSASYCLVGKIKLA